ncbi:amino acid transporter [Actinoplanes philippinensis]|uniref:Basic amino acid/polyamine antiporter, APA family n=1 Tax=Actinoplanes philippinensis TaxID=35752 RepID=A0A1I2CL50_9ACTN|nr:amino acid permease [Actinoplanes philippinensis]GIE74820.1 amino acid transporter [Actinoplanes philippinensis]SFE69021.1 basic amino acid/polyamine antiporter, APA family [Actinoplanes philippinensis]
MAGRGIFAVRDVRSLISETSEEGTQLKRAVGATQLTAMGVGAIIGTGIFVVIGKGSSLAGPAVILSFVLAAVACAFSALSYAELASSIPVSGSAYTYAYATLGELVAWIIGWDLILEYGVSVAAIAVGWGGNLNAFLDAAFGYSLPDAISAAPEDGGVFNLPAVFIVLAITFLLVRGVTESVRVNLIMVVIKLAVLVFFIAVAFVNFSTDNFTPFAPEGVDGVTAAAAIIFFAYIGFDAVSTGSEEARNPAKDLPLAILGSLVICTVFYVLTVVGAIGIASPAQMSESDAPLAAALDQGAGLTWAAAILALGAVVAITSVVLVIFYGQTRIFFAMCRDGLLPRRLATVNQRYGTPARLTIGLGVLIAILAALVPLGTIVELVNIGTLFAFVLVNIGVIVLRRTRPDMPRPYRVPWSPVLPLIGVAFAVYLMTDLPWDTWLRFVAWLAVGLVIYFAYGHRHSRLRTAPATDPDAVPSTSPASPGSPASPSGTAAPSVPDDDGTRS